MAARAKYCMGTRKPRLAKKKCCATSVERSRSSRVDARRRHRLASSARRREKDGALTSACGGSERDEEAVDRNDEDVSLDAREPTIAYDAGAGLAMEVITFSIHRAASSLRSGYAWVRPAAWRIHSTGRAMPNLARWVSCLLCREQFRGRWLLHVRLARVDDKADAVQSSGVGVAREPGEELLVIAGGVAWSPLRGQRARHDQVGRLEADRVTDGPSRSASTIRSSLTYGVPSRCSRSKNRRRRSSISGRRLSTTIAPWASFRDRKRWYRSASHISDWV